LLENEVPAYLAEAAIQASVELKTKALLHNTLKGRTARYLAAFRGENPVYAKVLEKRVVRELALSYGVFPSLLLPRKANSKWCVRCVKSLLKEMFYKMTI
jgi:pyruvate kinase